MTADMLGNVLEWRGWDWITLGSVVLGIVGALAFVVQLQIQAGWDWWRNPFGRYLMMRKALLAALFVLVLINGLAGAGRWRSRPDVWTGQSMVTAWLMFAFALQTFIPYRLLLRVQGATHATGEAGRMTNHNDAAGLAGPRGDGSHALTRESRWGQATTFGASVVALGAAGALLDLDLSTLPGWLSAVAATGVAALAGTLTAWATRNAPGPMKHPRHD